MAGSPWLNSVLRDWHRPVVLGFDSPAQSSSWLTCPIAFPDDLSGSRRISPWYSIYGFSQDLTQWVIFSNLIAVSIYDRIIRLNLSNGQAFRRRLRWMFTYVIGGVWRLFVAKGANGNLYR